MCPADIRTSTLKDDTGVWKAVRESGDNKRDINDGERVQGSISSFLSLTTPASPPPGFETHLLNARIQYCNMKPLSNASGNRTGCRSSRNLDLCETNGRGKSGKTIDPSCTDGKMTSCKVYCYF